MRDSVLNMTVAVLAWIADFWASVKLPFYSFVGAFTLYLLNRLQDKHPFSLFRAININVSTSEAKPPIILLDMMISSALGATVVVQLTSPGTVPQALIAGLGVTGILTVHVKELTP